MFPAFFALVNPVSTIANPACIKNTNAAPIKNQMPNTSVPTLSWMADKISSVISFLLSSLGTKKVPAGLSCSAPLCTVVYE